VSDPLLQARTRPEARSLPATGEASEPPADDVDPCVKQTGGGRSHPWWRRHRYTRWADITLTLTSRRPDLQAVSRECQTRICRDCRKRQIRDVYSG